MAPRPPSSKMTPVARPVARYRKGQPLPGASTQQAYHNDDDDDSDEQDGHRIGHVEQQPSWEHDQLGKQGLRLMPSRSGIQVAIKGVQVDDKGKVKVGRDAQENDDGDGGSSEEEDDPGPFRDGQAQRARQRPDHATPSHRLVPRSSSRYDSESSSEYETDDEDEEEEPQARAPIYKPVFVSKRNRDTLSTRDAELDPELVDAKREQELRARKQQAHDLVAQSIVRELAQRSILAGDGVLLVLSAEEVQAVFPDVDDTDGLDPEAEFEAWKLRELMRIKRDKEARYAKEKEREQVEARRAMPEQLRLKEDLDYAKKTRDEKKKGSQVFGQKYHHKGAFYADAEILTKHDFTAPTVSTVKDMSSLPKAMQNKNFGKMSQSKYTHLADQDTSKEAKWGRSGGGGGSGSAGGGCFNCGGPHVESFDRVQMKKDCPTASFAGPSGANTAPSRDQGWPSRGQRGDESRDEDRDGGGEDRYDPRQRREEEEEETRRESSSRRGYEDRERDREGERSRDHHYRGRDRDSYGDSGGGGGGGGSGSNQRRNGIGHSGSSRDDRSYDDKRSRDDHHGRREDKLDYDERRRKDDRPRVRSQSPRGPEGNDKRRRLD
ncbi:BQ2448_3016 [Microbotryum intermedium]|uniref:BQ2448_3016 protein n=1 Tax=Microbotryum intermedium TaxID=269621 RepID=A0A238FJS8_9BASI|nr:BQ2448_3016 [Microbotryum intermedium]